MFTEASLIDTNMRYLMGKSPCQDKRNGDRVSYIIKLPRAYNSTFHPIT